ncbi:MAG: hypothetical protein IVW55_09600 [Chloroflexi bacterium]|nr:hypothetical protein [Chloroflexota bacterium]
MPEAIGQPLLNSLCTALQNKQMLLVLDSFEQLITAAPQIVELLLANLRKRVAPGSTRP